MTVSAALNGTGYPLLEVRDVCVRFGGIRRARRRLLSRRRGQILGLIGPNGAGKTTLFNCLSRLYTPPSRRHPVRGRARSSAARRTASPRSASPHVPEPRAVRPLTVLDNVLDRRACARRSGTCHRRAAPAVARGARRRCSTPRRWRSSTVSTSGRWRTGRSPTCRSACRSASSWRARWPPSPKLLLLDEPAGGLNHEEVAELGELIRRIRDERGVTVLLVEHHMGLVMSVSDDVVVLNFGRKIAEGTPAEVQRTRTCIRAYLGERRRDGLMLLEVEGLHAFYGPSQALHGIDFRARRGRRRRRCSAPTAPARRRRCARSAAWSGARGSDPLRRQADHRPPGRPRTSCAAASRTCPKAAAPSARLTVEENLQLGAMTRRDRTAIAADIERCYG